MIDIPMGKNKWFVSLCTSKKIHSVNEDLCRQKSPSVKKSVRRPHLGGLKNWRAHFASYTTKRFYRCRFSLPSVFGAKRATIILHA